MTVSEFAPAKINLTLHVTGQRADGMHLLDSLVVFAEVGDEILVETSEQNSLHVSGPFAADVPLGFDNLALRAVGLFTTKYSVKVGLKKILPVASGIGGGSADAAAVMRAVSELWNVDVPDSTAALTLGADVPVCLAGRSTIMGGIGEILTPKDLPKLHLVLVNCGVTVNTGEIFGQLRNRANPPMSGTDNIPQDLNLFCDWLGNQRNDLEGTACEIAPEISQSLKEIKATENCLLARMSGSGATCFGIFPTEQAARNAASQISSQRPGWWVQATSTIN